MDAYRGIAKLLDRRQVAPGATVSLAVRAWVGTGFVGITPHTAWGKQLRRAVDTGYWVGGIGVHTGTMIIRVGFALGAAGRVGKPVHTVYGLYNVSKIERPLLFFEGSFRKGQLSNTR